MSTVPSLVPITRVPDALLIAECPVEIIVPPVIVNLPLFRFWIVDLSDDEELRYTFPEIVAVPPSLYKACFVVASIVIPPVISINLKTT